MAEKNNAVCSICGRSYHKCLSCHDSMNLQPWKMLTDTAECYKVFQVVKGFSTGVYTKDEFKSKLKNIDLSDLENYREHIKAIIEDALKEDEPVVGIIEKVEEPIEKIIETEEVAVEDVKEIEKPFYSRKKNYKVETDINLF